MGVGKALCPCLSETSPVAFEKGSVCWVGVRAYHRSIVHGEACSIPRVRVLCGREAKRGGGDDSAAHLQRGREERVDVCCEGGGAVVGIQVFRNVKKIITFIKFWKSGWMKLWILKPEVLNCGERSRNEENAFPFIFSCTAGDISSSLILPPPSKSTRRQHPPRLTPCVSLSWQQRSALPRHRARTFGMAPHSPWAPLAR